MPRVVIVIPVYNESSTIADTIAEFHQAMPEAEIVVVNNGSTDVFLHAEDRRSVSKYMNAV